MSISRYLWNVTYVNKRKENTNKVKGALFSQKQKLLKNNNNNYTLQPDLFGADFLPFSFIMVVLKTRASFKTRITSYKSRNTDQT